MASMIKISVSLPGDMIQDLKAAVRRGAYASVSEAVREAVRDWQVKYKRTLARMKSQ